MSLLLPYLLWIELRFPPPRAPAYLAPPACPRWWPSSRFQGHT